MIRACPCLGIRKNEKRWITCACDMFTFVDDERVTGATRELTWQAGHRLAYIEAYLGVQDAARKLRKLSKLGGAWAGSVVHTNLMSVYVCWC